MTATTVTLDRLPSGIPGIDTILQGGFLRGGVYIIQGLPGSGKTILANQVCFAHVAGGERAVYATLLAESHARLLLHLKGMRFFDQSRLPESLFYMSGFNDLEQHGLRGLLDVLRREVRQRKATLLVLDGLVTIERSANDEQIFRRFIHDLQVNANLVGCTVLLLNSSGLETARPEHTMVDGVIELADTLIDRRAERVLQVKKFRGTDHLRGTHAFTISDDGIAVHPRLEARYQRPSTGPTSSTKKLPTGIEHLDASVGGGLGEASTTLLVGPSGAGKTLFGMHFLAAAAAADESSLYFGFYENPAVMAMKAHRIGLGFDKLQQEGRFHCLWQPATEDVIDAVGQRLIDAVRTTGARRVFVDGLDAFMKCAQPEARISAFLTALTNELRSLNATVVLTLEVPNLISNGFKLPIAGVSTIVDNLIIMRFVEVRTQLFRMLSVLKMRDSEHDTNLREFRITPKGIVLSTTSESAEIILAGLGRPHESLP